MIAFLPLPTRLLRPDGYVATALGLAFGTLLLSPLHDLIDLSNVALLYVLAVVVAGLRYGRGVAIFCALSGSLLFAYVFVPPHFSLAITDLQYLLSAGIMFVVALLVGHLTANLRAHAEMVEAQEQRTQSLYEFARQLTATRSRDDVVAAGVRFLAMNIGARQARFVAPEGVAMLAPATGEIVLPLATAEGEHGAVSFIAERSPDEAAAQQDFIATVGSLMAVALERMHYLERAKDIEVQHAAESLRATILSSLSHDIRTPLTALVGTADTLLLGDALPADRQRSLLKGLREQARSIHQLVNNLLDMARLQAGNIELNLAWQPIDEVVDATLRQIRAVDEDRPINVAIAKDLPPLRIDGALMERALWNLLENAIKYSPQEAAIDVAIGRAGERVEIRVCDRGVGLPAEPENLFGLFQRGRSESNVPGAGIGLAIVKSVAAVHDGELAAWPREGGGSCFCLSLPVGVSPDIAFGDEA